jgi:hypothetical protein
VVEAETLWWVRVEVFVDVDSANLAEAAYDLVADEFRQQSLTPPPNLGIDEGTGMGDPVVGVVFTLGGPSPGVVADRAVLLVLKALHAHQEGLYGVSVMSFRNAPTDPPDWFPAIGD